LQWSEQARFDPRAAAVSGQIVFYQVCGSQTGYARTERRNNELTTVVFGEFCVTGQNVARWAEDKIRVTFQFRRWVNRGVTRAMIGNKDQGQ